MGVRALGMISGGLDSLLAARLVIDQGIEVTAVHFITGFGTPKEDYGSAVLGAEAAPSKAAVHGARLLGVPLRVVDVSDAFFPIAQNPRHGYGANMNPCIDCKILMFTRTRALMETLGAKFMFTGEVLGQRPMTQHRHTLKQIETESGMTGRVLRPLSAQLLDPTIPETKGWVDRARLEAISGRSRDVQVALAERLGFKDGPRPAGGCCHLINPDYSRRVEDFLEYRRPEAALDRRLAILLGIGRHFRLSPSIKIVVGRDEKENGMLGNYRDGRQVFRAVGVPAADVLAEIPSQTAPEDLERIASVAAYYSDAPKGGTVTVERLSGQDRQECSVTAARESDLNAWRI